MTVSSYSVHLDNNNQSVAEWETSDMSCFEFHKESITILKSLCVW